MTRQTLRELAQECQDVEYIATRGRYALVRLPDGLGGKVHRVTRETLEHWLDEDALALDFDTGELR